MISINMRFYFGFCETEIELTSKRHLFLLWSHNPTILVQITVRSKKVENKRFYQLPLETLLWLLKKRIVMIEPEFERFLFSQNCK